jgi:hypothetical protein
MQTLNQRGFLSEKEQIVHDARFEGPLVHHADFDPTGESKDIKKAALFEIVTGSEQDEPSLKISQGKHDFWRVVRFSYGRKFVFENTRPYDLKFGRIKFKLLRGRLGDGEEGGSGEGGENTDFESNCILSNQFPEKTFYCHYCRQFNNWKEPDLMVSSCKCNGQNRYVHLDCLSEFMRKQAQITVQEGSFVSIKTDDYTCSVCKSEHQSFFNFKGYYFSAFSLSSDLTVNPSENLFLESYDNQVLGRKEVHFLNAT